MQAGEPLAAGRRLAVHQGHARMAGEFVAMECLDQRRRGARGAAKQHRVLDRAGGALAEPGQHRVRGIAEQRDATRDPARQRLAREQAPLVAAAVRHGREDRVHLVVEVGEGGAHVGDAAELGPAFRRPLGLARERDEVQQRAAAHRVAHEQPPGPGADR